MDKGEMTPEKVMRWLIEFGVSTNSKGTGYDRRKIMHNKQTNHKTNPAPIKWRNNPLDYNYPRTSKDAFGFDIGEGEFKESMISDDSLRVKVWVIVVLVLVLAVWVTR